MLVRLALLAGLLALLGPAPICADEPPTPVAPPAPAEPVPGEPAPTEPAPAEPAPSEPPPSDPPPGEPTPAPPGPAPTDAKPPEAPPATEAPVQPPLAPVVRVPIETPAADPALLTRALAVESSLVAALAKVRRHTVSVLNLRKDREGRLRIGSVGSGVLVSKASKVWVITNVHVTAGAEALDVVGVDGHRRRVEVHDQIARYDFALLRFSEKTANLKGVEVKRTVSTGLQEGSWVLATGNPFFLALDGCPVCTLGVISGTDRILPGEYFYGNAIQHDAEVNPGNSGGPLWNAKGELIGINGKIASRPGAPGAGPSNTGASFSIPIHQVAGFLDELIKEGDSQAGFLGVEAETLTDKDGNPDGARITALQRGSPLLDTSDSKRRPLVVGDVIEKISFNGKPFTIRTAADLTNAVVLYASGTKVTISYRRGKNTLSWAGLLGQGG